jgi:hypothetical protein
VARRANRVVVVVAVVAEPVWERGVNTKSSLPTPDRVRFREPAGPTSTSVAPMVTISPRFPREINPVVSKEPNR